MVQWFAANRMYVLIDYHPMGQEWVQNDGIKFVNNWKWLWGKVACLPNFQSDLKVGDDRAKRSRWWMWGLTLEFCQKETCFKMVHLWLRASAFSRM